MYQAAIVEDEVRFSRYFRDTLSAAFLQAGAPVSFETYADGQEFLAMYEQHFHYDLIFLERMGQPAFCKSQTA